MTFSKAVQGPPISDEHNQLEERGGSISDNMEDRIRAGNGDTGIDVSEARGTGV